MKGKGIHRIGTIMVTALLKTSSIITENRQPIVRYNNVIVIPVQYHSNHTHVVHTTELQGRQCSESLAIKKFLNPYFSSRDRTALPESS